MSALPEGKLSGSLTNVMNKAYIGLRDHLLETQQLGGKTTLVVGDESPDCEFTEIIIYIQFKLSPAAQARRLASAETQAVLATVEEAK